MFKLISEDATTRTQIYSDGLLNVTITIPLHLASGFPLEVSVSEVEQTDASPETSAKVEGEDVQPPATPEAFEKL